MKQQFERHPLSAACGEMDPDEFMALQESVGRRGPTRKVILFEGKVLDGWHLYQAGVGLEIELAYEEFKGTHDEAESLVWDTHGARRNWSKSQRATIKAILHAQKAAQGDRQSIPEVAADAHVGLRTMEQATAVVNKGAKEVVKAVVDGNISLKSAEQVVQLPKREQGAALREPPKPRGASTGSTVAKPASGAWRAAKKNIGAPAAPQVGVSKDKYEEMKERNAVLSEELDAMTARLAVHFMEGTDEEKQLAGETIAALQKENRELIVKLDAITATRDSAVRENNELMRQCAMYRNQLQKFGKKAA